MASGGEVQTICNATGLKVLELEYREPKKNVVRIQSTSIGEHPMAKYLKDRYSNLQAKSDTTSFVNKGNELYLKDSDLKRKFLKYSSTEERKKDPKGYRATVIDLMKNLVPLEFNKVDWFLNLKDKAIISTH